MQQRSSTGRFPARRALRSGLVAVVVAMTSCDAHTGTDTGTDAGKGADAAAAPSDENRDLTIGARLGPEGSVLGTVKYKIRAGGRELEVEVVGADPGTVFAVSIDDRALGEVRVGLEGEGELKVVDFPDGLVEPQLGTVVVVGDRAVSLGPVEKLADLETEFGDDQVTIEASYKLERFGTEQVREFEVDIEGKPRGVHVVHVGGFSLGEIVLDEQGEVEVVFSDIAGPPFPPGFPALASGSRIDAGSLGGVLHSK